MRDAPKLNRDHAEWIAIGVLGKIASDPLRLERFLTITGFRPDTIRSCAKDSRFLAGVVDYVVDDEALLQAIITELACHPNDIAMAQHALRELPEHKPTPNVVRLPLPPRRLREEELGQ